MAQYFGVRHLSPACAYYAVRFLEKVQPEAVLIEGPSDLSELIKPLCSSETIFPAAILAYTDSAPVKSVLWPFADFSPELAAMKWAVKNNVPVSFCDLPSDCVLAQLSEDNEEENSEKNRDGSVYARLERASGTDNDSFWEYCFEQCDDYDDFIAAAEDYGRNLRGLSQNDSRNMLREAYMRRVIHDCENKYAPGRVAVITGAFHTAGLKNVPFSDEDKKLTDKLPTVKSKATLMPYSYYRLSSRSGYGAGSKAPGYFEILWKNRLSGEKRSAAEYLAKIAAYQRSGGYACSSAEVIEAMRLADTLANMRGGKYPCLADLRDAAVTCMGHGSFGEISLACADTEIGARIGSLPEGTVCTGIQEDFTRQLKELKLEKYRKATAEDIELDLRENIRAKTERSAFLDLNRSFFLHRLRICGISFCEKLSRPQDGATWAEKWSLRWTPEAEIEIVEASLKGDTIKGAAESELNIRLQGAQGISDAAKSLSDAFECGLTDCVKTAVYYVQRQAAGCSSVTDTGKAVGELSSILRFGSIRRLDTSPVEPLLEKLFLSFCLGIPSAAVCDRAAGEELISALALVNDACLSHDFLDEKRFEDMLSDIADNNFTNHLVSGYSCALLCERGKITSQKLTELISRRLGAGTPPAEGALWFEGLAKRNRRSLINRLTVWEKLCGFVSGLDEEEFRPVLVCLRRTFSDFTPSEKSDIAENIGEVLGILKEAAAEFVTAQISAAEQQKIDSLDDFDFGDI